ncbi:hypothetical protein FRC19_003621 [Serendipita sp. 401]|nr:hypothetical protein FRC19_003621 [Serendipita sp. 401]KAG9041377.1 hypothetical protein FS842_002575 [Serendipita sp. 407]
MNISKYHQKLPREKLEKSDITNQFVGDISDVPLDPDPRSIWFAKTARDDYCKTNNFPPRKLQLPDRYCIWLKGYLDVTNQRLLDYTEGGTELAFEQVVRGSVKVDGKRLELVGAADIIQGETHPIIHEIKFIFSPSTEDIMQVALYGYLWACQNRQSEIPELRVFNVRTGEVIKVESTLEKMESLIRDIARWKYSAKSKLNDEDLIARCNDELKKMSGVMLYNSVDSEST